MSKWWLSGLALAGLCCPTVEIAFSQVQAPLPVQGQQLDGSVAIDRALKASTLTQDGKPFYALMELSFEKSSSFRIVLNGRG
jgi:hypothetical protein